MVLRKYACKKCLSENIVLNGKNKRGSQTYECNNYGCCRVLFSLKKTKSIELETLIKTYQERNSTPSTGSIVGISHVRVWNYLKKQKV